jgi:hypothetical protein
MTQRREKYRYPYDAQYKEHKNDYVGRYANYRTNQHPSFNIAESGEYKHPNHPIHFTGDSSSSPLPLYARTRERNSPRISYFQSKNDANINANTASGKWNRHRLGYQSPTLRGRTVKLMNAYNTNGMPFSRFTRYQINPHRRTHAHTRLSKEKQFQYMNATQRREHFKGKVNTKTFDGARKSYNKSQVRRWR